MLLGNELIGQRDRKAARAAFEAARAAGDRRSADPAIALLDMDEGAFEPARVRLTELLKTHDTPQARLLLGQIEARTSADSAVQHYLQALKLDPANIQVLNNLANLLADTGKLDDARLWADKALARAPEDPIVLDTVGWIYFRQNRYPQALEFLRSSLRLRDRPVAHYHLAAALLKAGSPEEARREFEIGVRQDPKSPDRAIVAALFPSSK